jgi:membrane peptidoglycan carboxypeptidase
LEEKVGVPAVVNMAERLGVPQSRLADVGANDGSLTIGSKVVSPLDMATAYATLAAHGLRCTPRYVAGAVDSASEQVDIATPPSCSQTVPAGVADTVTSILTGVITHGTGYPNAALVGRPAAGKTGTTDEYRSAWFVGYTPQLAAAVALGDPRGPVKYPLRDVDANGRIWPRVFGGDLPALIWGRSMQAALTGQTVLGLAPADPTVATGTKGGLLSTPPPTPTPAASPGGIVVLPGRNGGVVILPGASPPPTASGPARRRRGGQ